MLNIGQNDKSSEGKKVELRIDRDCDLDGKAVRFWCKDIVPVQLPDHIWLRGCRITKEQCSEELALVLNRITDYLFANYTVACIVVGGGRIKVRSEETFAWESWVDSIKGYISASSTKTICE